MIALELLRWPVVALVALALGLRVFQLIWDQRVAIALRERTNTERLDALQREVHTRAHASVTSALIERLETLEERVRSLDGRVPTTLGARKSG